MVLFQDKDSRFRYPSLDTLNPSYAVLFWTCRASSVAISKNSGVSSPLADLQSLRSFDFSHFEMPLPLHLPPQVKYRMPEMPSGKKLRKRSRVDSKQFVFMTWMIGMSFKVSFRHQNFVFWTTRDRVDRDLGRF